MGPRSRAGRRRGRPKRHVRPGGLNHWRLVRARSRGRGSRIISRRRASSIRSVGAARSPEPTSHRCVSRSVLDIPIGASARTEASDRFVWSCWIAQKTQNNFRESGVCRRETRFGPAGSGEPLVPASGLETQSEALQSLGLTPAALPRHIAIIMDGNGRWAQRRGLPRIEGHRRGVQSVRATVEECCRLGIEQLSLYCLSIENWKRPKRELDLLMKLLERYLVDERPTIMSDCKSSVGAEGCRRAFFARWTSRSK
jgi:hypothetical protein